MPPSGHLMKADKKAIPFTAWDERGKMKSWNWSKLMTRIKGASFDITEEGFQSDTF